MVVAAALIMGTVFAAFILSADRIPKEFGLLLAVAILTDALIVRMTLVPAFLTLLGEKSWYIPRWLDRLLPNITIESPHESGDSGRARRRTFHGAGRPALMSHAGGGTSRFRRQLDARRPIGLTLRLEPSRQSEEREDALCVEEEGEFHDVAVGDLEHLQRPRVVAAPGGARLVLPERG